MPNMPASDKRKQFAALGFIAGMGLGAIGVLLLRQLSGRILYSDDLTALLPPATEPHVFPVSPSREDYVNFLGELQLLKQWRSGCPTTVSITRFDSDTKIPLSSLAEVAASLGLRTLLVCTSEEDTSGTTGFADQIREPRTYYTARNQRVPLYSIWKHKACQWIYPETGRGLAA